MIIKTTALFFIINSANAAFITSSTGTTSSTRVGWSPVLFVTHHHHQQQYQSSSKCIRLGMADTETATETVKETKREEQTLGLLTFDLDDTLYPIEPVVEEANNAFVKAMAQYGYEGLKNTDIIETGKAIREEIGKEDPEKAATLTHTEIRELAIRKEMEKVILERKLQACADDWATQVSSLSAVVVDHAKKWAKNAVSESVVQAVLNSWEMERHHAAERHIYPEVIDALKKIKEEHPSAIIGAVTDGRANPMLMTFTLAPYFDFCCSWEDDQGGRKEFFKELDATDGESAQLSWIYDMARYNYAIFKQASEGMSADENVKPKALTFPDTYDDRAWIHVGDDLAFDVGGSKACGAKTIYAELAEKYGQTARTRFDIQQEEDDHAGDDEADDNKKKQPSWSTTSSSELRKRIQMNKKAESKVDVTLNYMSQLPDAINEILSKS